MQPSARLCASAVTVLTGTRSLDVLVTMRNGQPSGRSTPQLYFDLASHSAEAQQGTTFFGPPPSRQKP